MMGDLVRGCGSNILFLSECWIQKVQRDPFDIAKGGDL